MLSPFKFQQFLNLGMNQGFKKALTTVRDYPSIIMLPAFSIWTYGSIEKGSYCQTSHQKIGLSFLNSFLNGFYTLCIYAIATSIFLTQYPIIFKTPVEVIFLAFSPLPFIVLSLILMSVVACMDTCSCCSCSCCCDCILTIPMTERTAFGHQEEEPTEIALVETNSPASPNNQTTANPTTSDATDIKIQEEATATTQV